MQRGILYMPQPFSRLLVAIMVVMASFLLMIFLSYGMAIPLFGISPADFTRVMTDFSNPASIPLLKFFQVMQSIGLFILPPFVYTYLVHGKNSGYLTLHRHPGIIHLVLVSFLIIAAIPFVNFTAAINGKLSLPGTFEGIERWMRSMEDNAGELTRHFLEVHTLSGLLFNLFMIAVLPALGEELLFRGVFQRLFSQLMRNAHAGIWISAFLFSALHLQFYGFVPRLLLGVYFGYLLVWSGTIWIPIAAHFANNAINVLVYHGVHKEYLPDWLLEVGSEPTDRMLVIISLILVSGGSWYLYRRLLIHHQVEEVDPF
jgi:uncharacterized protein